MKSAALITFLFLQVLTAFSQVPHQFRFQGIARNAAGQAIGNQTVSVRLAILLGSVDGMTLYQETHSTPTAATGVFNVTVGTGSTVSGSYLGIIWGQGTHFLKVEIDPAGGSAYLPVSTTQLYSVPYAIVAKTLEGGGGASNGDHLEYQNGAWTKKLKRKRYPIAGTGNPPTSFFNFIGPTATIVVERDNPSISVYLSKVLGSTQTGTGLFLNLGYRKGSGAIEEFDPGPTGRMSNLRVPPGTKIPFSLSGSFETQFKAGDTIEIGIVGFSGAGATWDDNDYGRGFVEVDY